MFEMYYTDNNALQPVMQNANQHTAIIYLSNIMRNEVHIKDNRQDAIAAMWCHDNLTAMKCELNTLYPNINYRVIDCR